MNAQVFTAVLIRPEGVGTWAYLDIPFDVEKVFGEKSRVKVKGILNNIAY